MKMGVDVKYTLLMQYISQQDRIFIDKIAEYFSKHGLSGTMTYVPYDANKISVTEAQMKGKLFFMSSELEHDFSLMPINDDSIFQMIVLYNINSTFVKNWYFMIQLRKFCDIHHKELTYGDA